VSDAASPLLAEAAAHFRRGDLGAAIVIYRRILAEQPDRKDALFLLAFMLVQGPGLDEGEQLLLKFLTLVPRDAGALHTMGKVRQARGDDQGAMTWFERALACKINDAPSWNDMGASLHRLGRLDDAISAFAKAASLNASWGLPLYNLGTAYYDQSRFDLAEQAYRRTLAVDNTFYEAYSMLASCLDQLHRTAEAETYADIYASHKPVVVKSFTGTEPVARVLLVVAAGMCNLRPDYLFSLQRYRATTVYVRHGGAAERAALTKQIPPYDIVFSAIADPDRAGNFLHEAADFCRQLGGPLINAPDERITRTRRDNLPDLLAGIPNLVLPATKRLTAEELTRMTETDRPLDAPVLIRPTGFHGGKNFEKFDRTGGLADYRKATPHAEYYLSPYVDYQSPDGYFRKYRFIFVDRKIYSYHLAISRDWLVHYYRTEMGENAWMRAEEEAFLADYRSTFPEPLVTAVEAVAKRVDLDYAGMDCGLTRDGRVLVFETNAAMLVHLHDPADVFPYKHRYVPRIGQAIDDMVRARIAAAKSTPSG
jgi:tetratricopeptide (TPR) repeat protein